MVVVEGDTDLPYVRKLVAEAGLEPASEIDAGGKGNIKRELAKYSSIGTSMPVVVFRDLDHDAVCGGVLLSTVRMKRGRWFRLRLAVRELESWVLADVEGLSRFMGVEAKWIPADPDGEHDPTRSLLKVAERSPAPLRRKLLPAKESVAVVGPLYEAMLIEFGERGWDPARASRRSPSLARARAALKSLASEWAAFVRG